MMSGKDGVGQVIKACVTVVTLIALTSRFRVIKATLNDVLRRTRRAPDAIGPAQLANSLITLHIIDEMLDVDLHGWTPVRDRGIGWRQYTPSSNATTLESNMSVTTDQGNSVDILPRRILRRGIPFGRVLEDRAHPETDPERGNRGLLFVSYQTS